MKMFILSILFLIGFCFNSFGQTTTGNCTGDGNGGCEVECPEGTAPDVGKDIFGDCYCGCDEVDTAPNEDLQAMNLEKIKSLKNYLNKKTEIKTVRKIIQDVEAKGKKIIETNLVLIDAKKYDKYFKTLRSLFLSLNSEDRANLKNQFA